MKNKLARAFEREGNLTRTENDAVTHASTFSGVLDFFYHAPTRQGQDNLPLFLDAYDESKNLALKALFYLRDVRQGKGQKKTFQDIIFYLGKKDKKVFDAFVSYVPEFGYWKDITPLVGFKAVQKLVSDTLTQDLLSESGVSLLAKWMPSENASSNDTRLLALRWAEVLGMSPREYRQALSNLRARIRIVESQMSANEWDEIDYSRVPSKAMKNYKDAFQRHDKARFDKFVEKAIKAVEDGEAPIIKSATLYPHELSYEVRSGKYSRATEAQWLSLPDYFDSNDKRVLVVVDSSGSMSMSAAGGRVMAIDVSVGLGIYCAQRNRGVFQDYVLTFSDDSHLVKTSGSLRDRVHQVANLPWGGSTNLMSAFRSILNMALDNDVPQEDMPTDILIISDMEFNSVGDQDTNLERAKKEYKASGYIVPRVTFWNVNSRHNQVPATQDEDSVLLVSGFSAETIGKVLNSKVSTPYEFMLEVLESDRYAFIDEIV